MSKTNEPTNFRKIINRIAYGHDTRKVFDGFVRLSACALAAQTREPEYLEEAKRWKPDELSLFAQALSTLTMEMERRPFEDLLGAYYMEFALSTKGQQWNGEFHTPKALCDLMAKMTMPDGLPPGDDKVTVCEPACGAGAMILALAESVAPQRRRLRVTAIDINKTACDMTFINTTLWGIPTKVIHGNTISQEFWSQWFNFHWLSPWLQPMGNNPDATPDVAAQVIPLLIEQGVPPSPEEVEQLSLALA